MDAIAYFLTWTTYGTWLPGDARGWVDRHRRHGEVVDPPDPRREEAAKRLMAGNLVTLDVALRAVARNAILKTATYRGWGVHALEVRSNHVHVVVKAGDESAGDVMRVLKAYASRAMNATAPAPGGRWWTRQGSKRKLLTDEAIAAAVQYVENQDTSWMKGYWEAPCGSMGTKGNKRKSK